MRVLLCICSGAVPDEKQPPHAVTQQSWKSSVWGAGGLNSPVYQIWVNPAKKLLELKKKKNEKKKRSLVLFWSFGSGATPLLSSAVTGSSCPSSQSVRVQISSPASLHPPSPHLVSFCHKLRARLVSSRCARPRLQFRSPPHRLKPLFDHELKRPLQRPLLGYSKMLGTNPCNPPPANYIR